MPARAASYFYLLARETSSARFLAPASPTRHATCASCLPLGAPLARNLHLPAQRYLSLTARCARSLLLNRQRLRRAIGATNRRAAGAVVSTAVRIKAGAETAYTRVVRAASLLSCAAFAHSAEGGRLDDMALAFRFG